MHIVMIPAWYKTPTNPSRGIFFVKQAQMLQNAGHQVGMIVPPSILRTHHGISEVYRYWKHRPDHLQVNHDDGFPVFRVMWWGWRGMIDLSFRKTIISQAFQKYIDQYGQPDILHGHTMIYGGYMSKILSDRWDIPYIITEHDARYYDGIPLVHFGHQLVVKRTIAGLTRMITVSHSLASTLRSYTGDLQIDVVGNSVDSELFKPLPSFTDQVDFTFSIIGRLTHLKRHDILLKAFAKEFRDKPIKLNIVGDGQEHERLKNLAKHLKIESQCNFTGIVRHNQIPAIINQSHVIISASEKETFGVTLIEALACGKPVIATRSGGPEDIVDDKTGILIERSNVDAMANAMQTIMTQYDNYDPEYIRAKCLEKFGEKPITSQLEEIYHSIIFTD